MRAPFNNTCDLVYGPGTATPGVVRSSGPCRVVPESIQIVGMPILEQRSAYVTLDFDVPRVAVETAAYPTLSVDYTKADRIVVPSGGTFTYVVLIRETVFYLDHPVYHRAHVGQPVDPFPNNWGFTCISSGVMSPVGVATPFDTTAIGVTWIQVPVVFGGVYRISGLQLSGAPGQLDVYASCLGVPVLLATLLFDGSVDFTATVTGWHAVRIAPAGGIGQCAGVIIFTRLR